MNGLPQTSWQELMRQWQDETARHECPLDLALEQNDHDDLEADRRHDHTPTPAWSYAA